MVSAVLLGAPFGSCVFLCPSRCSSVSPLFLGVPLIPWCSSRCMGAVFFGMPTTLGGCLTYSIARVYRNKGQRGHGPPSFHGRVNLRMCRLFRIQITGLPTTFHEFLIYPNQVVSLVDLAISITEEKPF